MNIFKRIFGMDEVIEKGADMLDNAFFTDQEKAAYGAKRLEVQLEVQRIIANESTPTAISRRILAFMIMGPFVAMILLGVAVYKFDAAWGKFILEEGVGRLAVLAGAVGTTYFIKDAIVKAIGASKE